jgi:eukaryotic-like serine/threonine-protein kinase
VLIAILAMVLIGTIIALALNSGDNGDTPTTAATTRSTPSSAPPSPTAPPTTAAPETIQIDRNSYIGMNIDDAAAAIEALGLPVNRAEGARATDPGLANTVSEVNPSGPVQPGTTITLTYLLEPETPATPSDPPTVDPDDPEASNSAQSITVSWQVQGCPAGQTLSGYEVTATNGATPATSVIPASSTQTAIQIPANAAAGTAFEVSYSYFCGALSSAKSPTATITVQ